MIPATAYAACPIELAVYGDPQSGSEIDFTPTGTSATVTNSFRMILDNNVVLNGIVMWNEGVSRPNGALMYKCPEGDVTGGELAACTSWHGVIYTSDDKGSIGLLPAEGVEAPKTLILPDLGPAGSGYALAIADKFIRSGAYRNVLVIGSEVFSRIIDFSDRTTCVLFGDGAGAVVLQASEEPGILSTALHADGSHANILCVPGNVAAGAIQGSAFLYMDGQAVFKLAVTVLDKVAREALAAAELDASQVDWLIPHQANIRIMQGTTKKLGLSNERLIVTVDEHGNTSAASIPLALDVAVRDGRIQRGQHVMLEGVGGGFTWGAALLRF